MGSNRHLRAVRRLAVALALTLPVGGAAQPGEIQKLAARMLAAPDEVASRVDARAFAHRVARTTDPEAARAAVREVVLLTLRTALEPLAQAGWADEPAKRPPTRADEIRAIEDFGTKIVDVDGLLRAVDVPGLQARLARAKADPEVRGEIKRIALLTVRETASWLERWYRQIQVASRVAADQGTLASLRAGITLYYVREGRYPSSKDAVKALSGRPVEFMCPGNDVVYDPRSGQLELLIQDPARC
jgi:hypothetical protein